MSFFKKLFGNGSKESAPEKPTEGALPWIEATQNKWGIRLLDLRPITQKMTATSSDPRMAANAVSYNNEDGISFAGIEPADTTVIDAHISVPIDQVLAPGVLFIPQTMEHKWAIYYHDDTLIFIRSWQRQVFVTAKAIVENDQLVVKSIRGKFIGDEAPSVTRSLLKYILISYAIGENVPAPLPDELATSTKEAGLWAFSMYGNRAQVGTFDAGIDPIATIPLRSHSMLHIAVARGDIAQIKEQFQKGVGLNLLAADGLAPLHWSIASGKVEAMETLLELGADPNVRSIEGATPLMNAAQSNKLPHLNLLLASPADINAADNRGFTALHRAAEKGLPIL